MPKTHIWITGPSEIDEVFRAYKKFLKAADDINPNQFAVFAKAITTERFHLGSAKSLTGETSKCSSSQNDFTASSSIQLCHFDSNKRSSLTACEPIGQNRVRAPTIVTR